VGEDPTAPTVAPDSSPLWFARPCHRDMDWPAAFPEGDVLITRDDHDARRRYVVHCAAVPVAVFQTYAEAEFHSVRRAGQTGSHVWYSDGRRFQMVRGQNDAFGQVTPPASRR